MLASIIFSNIIVGLVGVAGGYIVVRLLAKSHSRLMFLVSFAAGAMVAVSFFDLLPEAIASQKNLMTIMEFFVLGFVTFQLIEKAHLYYHCHEESCEEHGANPRLIILGDAMHNFFDGVAIAASFLAGVPVGIFTTIAIIIHEIPQEVGDIGVLIHYGYSRAKALAYNLLSAVTAIAGGVIAYFFLNSFTGFVPYVLAFTAGGFIYIATVDLLPELRHEHNTRAKISLHSLIFILGVIVLWAVGKFIGE